MLGRRASDAVRPLVVSDRLFMWTERLLVFSDFVCVAYKKVRELEEGT